MGISVLLYTENQRNYSKKRRILRKKDLKKGEVKKGVKIQRTIQILRMKKKRLQVGNVTRKLLIKEISITITITITITYLHIFSVLIYLSIFSLFPSIFSLFSTLAKKVKKGRKDSKARVRKEKARA